jgi:flagellar hook-associated protein 1 FlgK
MGLINGALQIGRSALQTYQSALQVVGNNIANAGNADYTRQSAGLSAIHGVALPEGLQPGAGVAITDLKRNLDESLENRIRAAIGDLESAVTRQQSLGRVETLFDDLSGDGVAAKVTEFFNGFSAVQNDPTQIGLRDIAVANGADLAVSLSTLRSSLKALGDELDGQIDELVVEADRLAGQIAELNGEIAVAEAGSGGTANALRDQRDALLRDLAEIFDVQVREQPDGSINVYVGSEPLIQGGLNRGLTTEQVADGDFIRTTVRFADGNSPAPVHGGKLDGLIVARDRDAYGRLDEIDQLTAALIFEVNRIHANGQGLTGFTTATGTYAVDDPTAALNSSDAGLDFAPRNGSFFIAVADDPTSTVLAYQIDVDLDGTDDDTTLESLVADINATVEGVTASVTADNRLQLEADPGFSFTFGHDGSGFREDTSDVLAALGVNTFFDGADASDVQVNDLLTASPTLLAAATVNLEGDGSNAGRLAGAGDAASDLLNGTSINDHYARTTTNVAVAGATALDQVESQQAVLGALQTQKDSISGVSLDEEALELLKFERAYQGAARYVTTVDRLLEELMALLR